MSERVSVFFVVVVVVVCLCFTCTQSKVNGISSYDDFLI